MVSDGERYLTDDERGWHDRCEASVEDWPSDDSDTVEAMARHLRSLAASRALVEELKTHIKMEGHGETVGITHEEGCHMCHALALKVKA